MLAIPSLRSSQILSQRKNAAVIYENALGVFFFYGRFFLIRKKSRKLNFLRVARFARNNKDINVTTAFFEKPVLFCFKYVYLKKIVIIVFWLPHKIRKSNFCGKRGKRWKGEKYVSGAGEYSTGGFLSNLASRAFGPSNEDYLW